MIVQRTCGVLLLQVTDWTKTDFCVIVIVRQTKANTIKPGLNPAHHFYFVVCNPSFCRKIVSVAAKMLKPGKKFPEF